MPASKSYRQAAKMYRMYVEGSDEPGPPAKVAKEFVDEDRKLLIYYWPSGPHGEPGKLKTPEEMHEGEPPAPGAPPRVA